MGCSNLVTDTLYLRAPKKKDNKYYSCVYMCVCKFCMYTRTRINILSRKRKVYGCLGISFRERQRCGVTFW